MKRLIAIGTPTHLRVSGPVDPTGKTKALAWTACGLVGTPSQDAAYDPRDVDCLNCRRTQEWKHRVEGVQSNCKTT